MESDFEVLEKIGRGGFASVYKVRNVVDNEEYAIKKISIKINNKTTKNIQKEIASVLKEIRCLAQMKNENVVSYNQSWIEVILNVRKATLFILIKF